MQRRSCRDLAGRGCCHIHPRHCRTDCRHHSLASWALGCWHPACGCSPPDPWPMLSFPSHWRQGNTSFNIFLLTQSFKEPVILRPQDEQGLVPVPYTVKYCVSNVPQTKMDEFQELLSHSSYLPLVTHFKSLLFSKLVPISYNQHFIICLITELPTIYLQCPRLINFMYCWYDSSTVLWLTHNSSTVLQ